MNARLLAVCASLLAAVLVASAGDRPVRLEWRPAEPRVVEGELFSLDLHAVSDEPVSINAARVIFAWDPTVVELLGTSEVGGQWAQSGLVENDPWGINESIPPADGDGVWEAYAPLGESIPIDQNGVLLTTFEFQAGMTTATLVEVLAEAGSPTADTVVLDAVIPNFNLLGNLGLPALVDIVEPCEGDINGDGSTGFNDLVILISWYNSGPGGDLDGDGDTDFSDLVLLIADYGCGPGSWTAHPRNGRLYRLSSANSSWSAAQQEGRARGGRLADVNNPDESAWLLSNILSTQDAWIGLTDAAAEGDWSTWTSGNPVNYSNWGVGQPDDAGGGEDYAVMRPADAGRWADIPQGAVRQGVLEAADCNGNLVPDTLDIARGTSADCDGNGIPDSCDGAAWRVFDPGAAGVGVDAVGYTGGAFDGRYVYFAPHYNGTAYSGEVLRYDTQAAFASAAAWASFNPETAGVGTNPSGYYGAAFDGRFVYFSPFFNDGNIQHGEVLRYDTNGGFTNPASWSTYDPDPSGTMGLDGYGGTVFAGGYVYFAPFSSGGVRHGRVLRYNTALAFNNTAAWEVFDAVTNGGFVDAVGYRGLAYDGRRYIYFSPVQTGVVLRYDTQSAFGSAASWAAFDAGSDGYGGVIYDGRFAYFTPYETGGSPHCRVLRYDSMGGFTSPASWSTFEPCATGLDPAARGFVGGAYDGSRFVYFAPQRWDEPDHGRILRLDTGQAFNTIAAWSIVDAGASGLGTDPDGYWEAVFDGRFIYFVPWFNGDDWHGEFIRLDTAGGGSFDCNGNDRPDACDIADGTSLDMDGDGVPDECQ